MYAITGITGKVGGALARTLLAAGQRVRAVVRDACRGRSWAEKGCEVALAEMEDAAALNAAFEGVNGDFTLPRPESEPAPGFPLGARSSGGFEPDAGAAADRDDGFSTLSGCRAAKGRGYPPASLAGGPLERAVGR